MRNDAGTRSIKSEELLSRQLQQVRHYSVKPKTCLQCNYPSWKPAPEYSKCRARHPPSQGNENKTKYNYGPIQNLIAYHRHQLGLSSQFLGPVSAPRSRSSELAASSRILSAKNSSWRQNELSQRCQRCMPGAVVSTFTSTPRCSVGQLRLDMNQ